MLDDFFFIFYFITVCSWFENCVIVGYVIIGWVIVLLSYIFVKPLFMTERIRKTVNIFAINIFLQRARI